MDAQAGQADKVMTMARKSSEKWSSRVHQYGTRVALLQAFRAVIRPLWKVKKDLVLAIPNHQPKPNPECAGLYNMTKEVVNTAAERGELNEQQRALLLRFLNGGCQGFVVEVDGHFAGYAFIQRPGTCISSSGDSFMVPEGMMLLKNLLVFPDFRGRSLGKLLNQARIASIPEGYIPIVLAITENRFAIRNGGATFFL